MPKRRRVEGYQNQRGNGDLACKRSHPARQWKHKHLYLVLDDWEKGYSIHKIDLASFDSDSDSDDKQVAVAGHLLEPPVLRLESPGDVDMLFATMGNKIFIVTDARYGQTPALIYDTETAALALGPAIPAHLQCGFSTVVAAHGMFYAFSPPACKEQHPLFFERGEQHSFDVMSCALTRSHSPAEVGWVWRSLPALPPPFSVYETITSYAVHSDGHTIYMTTSYRDRPGLQKSTYSFSTKYSVWRWHSWALPFRDEGYFDSELDAWVGLRWDGYICCCQLPTDNGSETPIELGTVELDWQLVEDKLFCRETEKHLRASLTYMGRSKFCLIRSAMREGAKSKYLLGDDGSCVLHLTMFGLKYNNKGELRFTNRKTSVSYRVTRHTDFFSPVAFWL